MRPVRTAEQSEGMTATGSKECPNESMNKVSHDQIMGMDVSRDWLDTYCLPDGLQLRLPNTADGHVPLATVARKRHALVCFETTGGQEWRL